MMFQVDKRYVVDGEITPDEAVKAVATASRDYEQLPVMTVTLRRVLGGTVEATVRCTDLLIAGYESPAKDAESPSSTSTSSTTTATGEDAPAQ